MRPFEDFSQEESCGSQRGGEGCLLPVSVQPEGSTAQALRRPPRDCARVGGAVSLRRLSPGPRLLEGGPTGSGLSEHGAGERGREACGLSI